MRKLAIAAIAFAMLAIACGTEKVDRNRWEQMNHADRLLYVKSMIGAEQVKQSKGGNDRVHPKPAEEYLAAIERAYASGDKRAPDEVFATMGEKR